MNPPEQKRQLEILGYTKADSRVRIRCFAPKGMPLGEQLKRGIAWEKDQKTIISIPIEGWLYPSGVFVRLKKKRCGDAVELDGNSNPVWREAKTYQNGIAYLRSLNVKGYGVYLIPNEGGGADTDITGFRALFYECDGISKNEQWQKLRSLESKLGRSASMVVETRNSLHCYFRLAYDNLLSSTWTQYQQRLIQQQQSDEAIWNPARLMRLVGFDHQKWNPQVRSLEQFPIQLAWESDNIFALDEFDSALPGWDAERWSQPQHQDERVVTDPVDNAWDIRNFIPYLDGYRANGRRGWDTCKCPAHNGESDNSLHVEQSSGAFKCHAGCAPKEIYHAALESAKSRGYQLPAKQQRGQRFSSLGSWLFKLKQQLANTVKRRRAWGFGRKGEVAVEQASVKSGFIIEYLPPGHPLLSATSEEKFQYLIEQDSPLSNKIVSPYTRLEQWTSTCRYSDFKYIWDSSAAGTGKSFDAGRTTPEMFGARQIIYASAEHRNPTTPTLQAWADLQARHRGLYRDEFGKLRRADKEQLHAASPNCGRNGVIGALRAKNIPGADTANLVCQTCPHLEPCRAGAVYGYLHERANALKQPRLRAHPDSLPNPAEYNYGDVALIWDEDILKAHRQVQVRVADLQRTIADLAVKLPQAFDTLRPLLVTLHSYLSGEQQQPNKYGWKDAQIRAALPKLENTDIEAVVAALAPDLDSLLNPTKEHGVDMADLKRSERKRFSEKDTTTASGLEQELALNWLPDFLDVLTGTVEGHLQIQHGTLTMTLPDRRLAEIAGAAKFNIFLDATGSCEDLARTLGVTPAEIFRVQQSLPDTSNLEIIQVATLGRLGVGSERSDFCQQRVDAIINKIRQDTPGKVAVIDFKRHTSQGDGKHRWWVDSRGVNDMEDCDALVMIGTPCRNLSDLEAEFTILYGRLPEEGTQLVKYPIQVKGQPSPDLQPYYEMEASADPEFREFCRRRILADIHQGFGRPRAHRRPEQQIKVYFVTDYPANIPVTLKKASDITPEAASKVERVEMAIRSAVQQLKDTGGKITQSTIATIAGYSQQYISRFRVLLQTLLDNSYSKSSKNGEPPPPANESSPEPQNPDEMQWMSRDYLPLLAESPPQEILEGLLTLFEVYGQRMCRQVWDATSANVQVKILQTLMFTFGVGNLRSLAAALEVII